MSVSAAFGADETSDDAFLGGRLHLLQPLRGYRAGIDPVLLAACVPARAGQSVLDLGCGAGAAMFCLGARVAGLHLTGVELQPAYADLARRNAQANGIEARIVCADLAALPTSLRQERFDHVIANPPYFRAGAYSVAQDAGRATALGGTNPSLADWIAVAARRLAPKGFLHMIQRAERLPELLAGCHGRLGSLEVLPLAARAGRAPDLVILRARKDGRAAFRLHRAQTLHQGATHQRDGDSYMPEIQDIFRNSAALVWPDC